MIKNLVLIAVIYLVYRAVKSIMLKETGSESQSVKPGRGGDDVMSKCPECGVYFPPRDGVRAGKGSEILYFCSEKCRDEYK